MVGHCHHRGFQHCRKVLVRWPVRQQCQRRRCRSRAHATPLPNHHEHSHGFIPRPSRWLWPPLGSTLNTGLIEQAIFRFQRVRYLPGIGKAFHRPCIWRQDLILGADDTLTWHGIDCIGDGVGALLPMHGLFSGIALLRKIRKVCPAIHVL